MPQHKEVYLTDSFKNRWLDIIEDVDITNVPVEYIDHLVLRNEHDNEVVISVIDLLEEGVDPRDLEEELTYRIDAYGGILSIDYVLNVDKVKTDIQLSTNNALKNL